MPSLDLELSTSSLSIVYREQFPAEASSFDQEKVMMPAIARSITRATDAGTAGANNTNSATRKCALKLNCPLPLFTIIRSVVTYTVDTLASPPARKYPITLSFGRQHRSRLGWE